MKVRFFGHANFYLEEIVDFPDDTPWSDVVEEHEQWLLGNVYDASCTPIQDEEVDT